MKRILTTCLTAFLFMSSFSYAADDHASKHEHKPAHHAAHQQQKNNTQPVDINHADAATLSTLKGIGLKKAQTIVTYRDAHGPFQSTEDLTHVKGIGAKTLARLEKNNPGRIEINSAKK